MRLRIFILPPVLSVWIISASGRRLDERALGIADLPPCGVGKEALNTI